jgi:hypothetical protein
VAQLWIVRPHDILELFAGVGFWWFDFPMSQSQLVVRHLARADSSGRASAELVDCSDEILSGHF